MVRMLAHRLPGDLFALFTLTLISSISAIRVTPGSPCASKCQGASKGGSSQDQRDSSTNASDIVCSDIDYFSSTAGPKFKECVSCLQTSHQVLGDESDSAWFLYNLRFATDVCLFGIPGAPAGNETSPCDVDSACGPLNDALQTDILQPSHENEFGYCTANDAVFRGKAQKACTGCLQASGDSTYLSNFLIALEAGCQQKPAPGDLLGISGSLFTESAVNITSTPEDDASSSSDGGNSGPKLNTGTIVGISVGAALLLLAAGLFILYCRRQRRYDREDELRRGGDGTYRPYTGTSSMTNRGYLANDQKDPLFDSQVNVNHNVYPRSSPMFQSYQPPGGLPGYTASDTAIPAHPAYIPKAMMRRNIPPINTGRQPTPSVAERLHAAETSPPLTQASLGSRGPGSAEPSPRSFAQGSEYQPSEVSPASIPNSRMVSTQSTPAPSPPLTTPPLSGTLPPHPSGSASGSRVPSLGMPNPPLTRQQAKRYSPPQIDRGAPIAGLEDMEISGPLAFPDQQQQQQQALYAEAFAGTPQDRRTFRERAKWSPTAIAHRRKSGRASALFNLFGSGDDRTAEQSAPKKRYEEVPIGGSENDLYG